MLLTQFFVMFILPIGVVVLGYIILYHVIKAAVRNGNLESRAITEKYDYDVIKKAVKEGIKAAKEDNQAPK